MVTKKWMDELWPDGSDQISKQNLQQLDEDEFERLRKLIYRRELRSTKSPKHSKSVTRKLVLKRRTDKRSRYTKDALQARYQECEILESFIPNRKEKWLKLLKRKRGIEVNCRDFSFIDNPIETSKTLHGIAAAECNAVGFRINFDDKYVQDVGPFLLLGVMREKMAPLSAGGRLSGATAKVLEAAGLSQFLSMKSFGRVPIDDVWPLPIRQRRRSGSSRSKNITFQPTTFEIAADHIVTRVDDWLGKIDPPEGLTQYGAGRIKSIIGEILNNAERHSRIGGDGEWITSGFMARRKVPANGTERHLHLCHLSLLNTGRPIAETIFEAPSDIVDQIIAYQMHHKNSGFRPETLATVFALQDGISRVEQGGDHPSGGTGMMDVVEFANEVGKIPYPHMEPKVAIISGHAYVRFGGIYKRGIMNEDTGRRIQWFNSDNDVKRPPDNNFVMELPYPFPGTLITLRFALDEQLGEETDGNADD